MLLLSTALAAISLLLLARALSRRGGTTDQVGSPQDESGKEQEGPSPPDREIEPEIRPLMEEGESGPEFLPPPAEAEEVVEIRPLLNEEGSSGCRYCAIFRDLGTAVCPNCGRPLNLRIIRQHR